MSLFDFIKGRVAGEPAIPPEERKYYQQDSYYTDTFLVASVGPDGKMGKMKVVTFDERKKLSVPSKRGLYVAEILLLEYCSYGTYPHPQNGYPGFWWFEYGIKNVGARLESLEQRGFIKFSDPSSSLPKLTIPELKEILTELGLPTNGKKQDLIKRILENSSGKILSKYVKERKYVLTETGKIELAENAYVPYMHKLPEKTNELKGFGPICNVWEVNRRLAKEKDWRKVVSDVETERKRFLNRNLSSEKVLTNQF